MTESSLPPPPPLFPPPPPGAVRVRWGIGDFFWVFLSQVLGVLAAVALWSLPRVDGLSEEEAGAYILFPLQYAVMALAMVLVARKGRGSLRADFGFTLRARDWPAFFAGMGWQVLMVFVLTPFVILLDTDQPSQETLRVIESSRSVGVVVVLGIGAVLVAPVVEEVLFRGLLLRALLRRMPPWVAISVSGVTFGAIHLLGAQGLAGVATVTGLSGLGMLLALDAFRRGSLSRPILTHMGFNFAGYLITLLV